MYKLICMTLVILAGSITQKGYSQKLPVFSQTFSTFARDEALGNASWSIEVMEAASGTSIFSHNSHLALTPASTQKIITTATSLMLLGSDFSYSTQLMTNGMVDENGILQGDLIIKGSGDPTLGASQMNDTLSVEKVFLKWLTGLRRMGIKSVQGRIIADDSVFDQELVPRKWVWEDIGNYYGAGSSGLSVNENMYTVFFRAGEKPGDPASVIGTEPSVPGMILDNQVLTGPAGSGDQVYILGGPYSRERILTGTVPAGANSFAVKGSMPDPPAFIASVFNDFLNKNKISTSGQIITYRNSFSQQAKTFDDLRVISSWTSPPLLEISKRTNIESHNTYAENLLKTLGYKSGGTGSIKSGTDFIYSIFEESGIDTRGMILQDGSGLSPSNKITSRQQASFLSFFSQHQEFENLLSGLPVAGISGSLENYFHGTPSYGILAAKSGYLGNVLSYAGYTRMQDGTLVAFSFIVNNYNGSTREMRKKMLGLLNAITCENNPLTYEQSKP